MLKDRDRIWWGAASNATAVSAAENRMHLQSSTLDQGMYLFGGERNRSDQIGFIEPLTG